MIKKNLVNKKVIKALSIGLSLAMAGRGSSRYSYRSSK